MVTAHSLLSHFPPSAKEQRCDTIIRLLCAAGVKPVVAPFEYGVNIYADVAGGGTRAVSAHYDVVNEQSENCQDNTASLCHMLALASAGVPCHLAFTDNEEDCCYDISGSKYYADNLPQHVGFTFCLELTAIGDTVWSDGLLPQGVAAVRRSCPLNDAVFMRRSLVAAACIGILPAASIGSTYPYDWMVCHSHDDRHDFASPQDMHMFTEYLTKAVRS